MPSPDPTAAPTVGVLRIFLALALLAGWVALLTGGMLSTGGGLGPGLRFAPLGFVSVFAFADRGFRLARAVLVAFPAFALGVVSAALALWLRERAAGPPGPSDLALPVVEVALGVWVGLAWRRGVLSVVLLPFKLATGALVIGLLVALLLAWALEKTPSVSPPGGTAPRAEAESSRTGDPLDSPPGANRRLRLTETDLNQLLAGVSPAGARPDRLRLAAALEADGRLRVSSSTRVPWTSRWLNGAASAQVVVRDGHLDLREPRLRLARFEPAPAALEALAPLLAAAVQAERPVRRVLPAIRELHVEPGALVVDYGPAQTGR